MDNIYFILFLVFIVVSSGFSLYKISKAASKFYAKADKLEKEIKVVNDKDEQLKSLFSLSRESFHRRTGDRVNELARMMEKKYNIKLLK